MKRLLMIFLFIAAFGLSMGFGQVDPNVEQGVHPFGSYDASKVDTINLQNGGLGVKIPLFSYPERGKFGATVEVVMSSKAWAVHLTCDQFTGSCSGIWELNPSLAQFAEQTIYPNPVGAGLVIDDGTPTAGTSYQLKELPDGRWVESGSPVANRTAAVIRFLAERVAVRLALRWMHPASYFDIGDGKRPAATILSTRCI